MSEIFRGFITKYALTQGIIETNLEVCSSVSSDMVAAHDLGPHALFHKEGRDWHRTKAAAVARAETMRDEKIKSVEKQLKKLRGLKFE